LGIVQWRHWLQGRWWGRRLVDSRRWRRRRLGLRQRQQLEPLHIWPGLGLAEWLQQQWWLQQLRLGQEQGQRQK